MRVVHEVVAAAFPRSVFGKDLDLNVGGFAALLATAFEKLGDIINILSITVGEGRQKTPATSVPVQIIDLRAAADKTQDAGGCQRIDRAEVEFGQGLRSLAFQNNIDNSSGQRGIVFDTKLLEGEPTYRSDARIIDICRIFLPKIDSFKIGPRPR